MNELQIQFKSEMEVVRQNLRTKENKLKAAKDKAEVEVIWFKCETFQYNRQSSYYCVI